MSIERTLTEHYTRGTLAEAIEGGLGQVRQGSDAGDVALLAPVDEFHTGGRVATAALVEKLGIEAEHRVLDIGCGIGGTARYLAERYGCRVEGVDLTPEYVEVGTRLNRETGLDGKITLIVGSATALQMNDGGFDRAVMLHVGMNIADKAKLAAEAARVLKPGGMFGLYDIMRTGTGDVSYPMPWSSVADTSFLASPDDYQATLKTAGFEIIGTENRRETALDFFAAMKKRMAEGGPPPLWLHLLMGPTAGQKVANLAGAIAAGTIAPVELIAVRR